MCACRQPELAPEPESAPAAARIAQARQLAPVSSVTARPVAPATPTAGASMMTTLPPLSAPVVVTNETGGRTWHWRNGEPKETWGDGDMGIVLIGDELFYLLVARTGTPPVSGAIWLMPYNGDPYHWPEIPTEPPKGLPGLPPRSITNIDTHAFAQNPISRVITFIHSSRPGFLAAQPNGSDTYAVQRATSKSPSGNPADFRRFPETLIVAPNFDVPWLSPWKNPQREEWFGGPQEASIVIDPPLALIFAEHKTIEGPDDFGQRFRGRIGRWVCPLDELDENPVFKLDPPTPVWEPTSHPNYGTSNATAVWGTANITPRLHVVVLPDGSYHGFFLGGRPAKRRDGTPANGITNRSVGFGHIWSHDKGKKWHWDDAQNPFIDWDSLGWSDIGIANRLNSPFAFVDRLKNVLYVGFWGNPDGEQNKLGTRLYLCEAQL